MIKLDKLTLLEVLNKSCEKHASNNFSSFVDEDGYSFSEFKKQVNEISAYLKNNGIIPGDKVSILSENQPNWGVVYFSITTMGAIAVPIMTEFHESEVHHILRHSESKAIFVSAKYFNKIEDYKSDDLTSRILLDDFSEIPPNTSNDKLKEFVKEGRKELAKIKAAAYKFAGLISDDPKEDDIALILYTSGTTGHSKGVMLTHKNVISDALATLILVEVHEKDKMLSILPLFHTIESTLGFLTPFIAGASVTYIDKPPTAAALMPALLKVKPTVMLSVPLVIEKIYRMRILPEINKKAITRGLYKIPMFRKKLNKIACKKLHKTFGGKLKMLSIGGAPIAEDVELFLREGGFPYAIGYGLTETSPLVTGTGPESTRFRSAGKALVGMEVKIDNSLTGTEEGEIIIKGPNVMKGYYKDPEKTKEVLSNDGWFRSGDLGTIDKDGYLFIKGRSKNVIIGANGKNIYPEEVESVINSCDFVLESLVLERENKLIAKVHLNYEEIDNTFAIQKMDETEARKKINELLTNIHTTVNSKISTFSRIAKVLEQAEPFEKTPTQKIKRYIYN